MNAQSFCREQMDNGNRCGLFYGHHGPHACCTIHRPREDRRYPE